MVLAEDKGALLIELELMGLLKQWETLISGSLEQEKTLLPSEHWKGVCRF